MLYQMYGYAGIYIFKESIKVNFVDIILIGIALSMDAFGVTLTNGMVYKHEKPLKKLAMPLSFAVFQALMPLIGFYAGSLFIDYISDFTKYLLFIIFLLLSLKMLFDGVKEIKNPKEIIVQKKLLYKIIFIQAFITSIDALAVGIGFSAKENINIFVAVSIIGAITLLICLTALYIGKKFGDMLGNKTPFLGAAILFFIALKSLFS